MCLSRRPFPLTTWNPYLIHMHCIFVCWCFKARRQPGSFLAKLFSSDLFFGLPHVSLDATTSYFYRFALNDPDCWWAVNTNQTNYEIILSIFLNFNNKSCIHLHFSQRYIHWICFYDRSLFIFHGKFLHHAAIPMYTLFSNITLRFLYFDRNSPCEIESTHNHEESKAELV